MDITYLKKLLSNPKHDGIPLVGLNDEEIDKAEKELNLKFPAAYKEFLFMAGKQHYLDFMPGAGTTDLLKPETYVRLLNNIKSGYVKPAGEIWAFEEMEDFDQFMFFYLNQGDDPKVYGVTYYEDDGEIYPLNMTFSSYINSCADDTKRTYH